MSRFKFFESVDEPAKNVTDNILRYNVNLGTLEYQLIQEQLTIANEQVISDTKTVMLWQHEHVKILPTHHQINLNLAKHDVIRTNQLFSQLSDFAKLFNAPVARLELKLDDSGIVIGIINQNEIFSIWNDIKAKELLPVVNAKTSESEAIILAGDKEFSNTLELVSNGVIYRMMFPGVYGITVPEERIIKQHFYPSNIVNDKKIEFEGKRISAEKDGKVIVKESFKDNSYGRHSSFLKETYDTQFKPVLNAELNYSYKVDCTYHFDRSTGLLEYANYKIDERLNDKFLFSSNYELTLKK